MTFLLSIYTIIDDIIKIKYVLNKKMVFVFDLPLNNDQKLSISVFFKKSKIKSQRKDYFIYLTLVSTDTRKDLSFRIPSLPIIIKEKPRLFKHRLFHSTKFFVLILSVLTQNMELVMTSGSINKLGDLVD